MNALQRTTSFALFLFLVISTPNVTFAQAVDEGSHFRYGTLSWAPTGTPGEVEFRLRVAFRRTAYFGSRCIPVGCSGGDGNPITGDIIIEVQGATRLNFGDSSPVTPTLLFLVTSFDVSSPNVNENWVLGEALDPVTGAVGIRHTYSGPGPFTAFLPSCCRLGQFGLVTQNNRSGRPYPLETVVAPQSGNSSPVSGQIPIVFAPQGSAVTFFVPGGDPDGDPIQWRLSTDAEAGGRAGTCPALPAPCHPPGFSINSSTGQVTWNNIGLSLTGTWQAQVVVEDLDAVGNVKTKTPVDFLLQILPLPPPSPPVFVAPTPTDGTVFTVFAGNTLTFTVAAQDPDAGDVVTLNHGGLPAGASFPIPPAANPVQSTFTWTPTVADAGIHPVTFTATDNIGFGALPRSFTIQVIPVILVDIDIKPGSDPNSINCNNDKEVVTVAILTTDDFDATTVDHTTVTFEGASETHVDKKTGLPRRHEEDVDGDGDTDLVFHFRLGETNLDCGSTEGTLTGETFDGQAIEGTDAVRMVEGGASKFAPEEPAGIPSEYALHTNYPNPFNPSTEIRIALPESAQVWLVVYDVLGRQVRVLVDQSMRAGTHAVTWDASGLPSGTYLYRLTAGDFSQTKLMTLLK